MSADNYYLIRKDAYGFFAPVMGFASNEDTPNIRLKHPRFQTVEEALDEAHKDHYVEYGVSAHPECRTATPVVLEEEKGHLSGCPEFYGVELYDFTPGEPTCYCAEIRDDFNTLVLPKKLEAHSRLGAYAGKKEQLTALLNKSAETADPDLRRKLTDSISAIIGL